MNRAKLIECIGAVRGALDAVEDVVKSTPETADIDAAVNAAMADVETAVHAMRLEVQS